MAEPSPVLRKRFSIALVDDDPLFREALGQNLIDSGFDVAHFASGQALLDTVASGRLADLILLDWKMPEMNGIEVLRRLRKLPQSAPVIFLTSLGDQVYEEAALAGGAIDFIEKSRSFTILLRRIELRLGTDGDAEIDFADSGDEGKWFRRGELELRVDCSRAYWMSQPVDLTLTEFRMVHRLAEQAGTDIPYRDLYDIVHGKDFAAGAGNEGYRTNVRTFIKRIRQKFSEIDGNFNCIENYAGFGYRWRRNP